MNAVIDGANAPYFLAAYKLKLAEDAFWNYDLDNARYHLKGVLGVVSYLGADAERRAYLLKEDLQDYDEWDD